MTGEGDFAGRGFGSTRPPLAPCLDPGSSTPCETEQPVVVSRVVSLLLAPGLPHPGAASRKPSLPHVSGRPRRRFWRASGAPNTSSLPVLSNGGSADCRSAPFGAWGFESLCRHQSSGPLAQLRQSARLLSERFSVSKSGEALHQLLAGPASGVAASRPAGVTTGALKDAPRRPNIRERVLSMATGRPLTGYRIERSYEGSSPFAPANHPSNPR